MIDHDMLTEVLALGEQRRAERRRFLKMAAATGAITGGAALLAACGGSADDTTFGDDPVTSTPTPPTTTADQDVLIFALQLEYLEASYYSISAFGQPLSTAQTTGQGTPGAVTGGRKVSFGDATVASYAREIAADEVAHVNYLRGQLAGLATAIPSINIDGGANGAFTAAARSAGIVSATGTFDPYANDDNWLLGGMLLSDVGVTAYKGSASAITSKTILEAAAGILATEAYHSGLIRTLLYRRGIQAGTGGVPASAANDRTYADAISNARDSIDGTTDVQGPPQLFADDDQGITPGSGFNSAAASNIVPADQNAVVFGRSPGRVLNVAYLNRASVTSGGFFPNGIFGKINASAAS